MNTASDAESLGRDRTRPNSEGGAEPGTQRRVGTRGLWLSASLAFFTLHTIALGLWVGGGHSSGVVVPLRPYVRIAGVSTLADTLLLALAEPERIDALSRYGREHSEAPHLYGARFPISSMEQLETLIERRIESRA